MGRCDGFLVKPAEADFNHRGNPTVTLVVCTEAA
jgi:hypothetical protein